MSDIPVLISDLAIILFSAGLITILFKWLKQPVVLGYIMAGIIAGPYTFGGPMIMDAENIHIWADIGVIFLLFALGLDFSFKKLMNIGGTGYDQRPYHRGCHDDAGLHYRAVTRMGAHE